MKYKQIDVRTDSVWNYVDLIRASNNVILGYFVRKPIYYYSLRYQKTILIDYGDISDGATGAPDLDSFGWLIHDELCNTGLFADGTVCTNLQASAVLGDIMGAEGKWIRRCTWFVGTWLFGGGKARDNGMW